MTLARDKFQAIGTGAVNRTVDDVLLERVSVQDFGAVGDGVTDDTAAIQAAIDYCTSLSNRVQTLYFPPNTASAYYKITSPLVITGRLNIKGDGQFSTTIMAVGFSAGEYILNFDCAVIDAIEFSSVANITLRGFDTVPNGLRVSNLSYLLVKEVYIFSTTIGIYMTGTRCFSNTFEQVTIASTVNYSTQVDSYTGGGGHVFNTCTFSGGSIGFYLTSNSQTDALSFIGCNFEQNAANDIYINGNVRGLSIVGCRSEGLNGSESFLISPTGGTLVNGLSITGCNWQTDSGNSAPVSLAGVVRGFNISGNNAGYCGILYFVKLNGGGDGGVIEGNYCQETPVDKIVSATRAGVVCKGNWTDDVANGGTNAGIMDEYDGTDVWNIEQSSYVSTATGMTTSPTGTIKYSLVGKSVTLDIPAISGTSNATSFTLTGMATILVPTTDKDIIVRIIDNGTEAIGFLRVKTTGVIELYSTITGGAFTASGTKAVDTNSISYTLD